jgi:Na+/H+ antiporter NhaD/arsenite permease-like protein
MKRWMLLAGGGLLVLAAWLVAQRMYQTALLLLVALVGAVAFWLVAPRRREDR